MRIETTILSNLIHNEEYTRKVIPFLNKEYFSDFIECNIYTTINSYVQKYNNSPDIEALNIDLQRVTFNEDQYNSVQEYLTTLKPSEVDFQWLLDLYKNNRLNLDGLITKYRPLEEVNEAFEDMNNGLVARSILTFK